LRKTEKNQATELTNEWFRAKVGKHLWSLDPHSRNDVGSNLFENLKMRGLYKTEDALPSNGVFGIQNIAPSCLTMSRTTKRVRFAFILSNKDNKSDHMTSLSGCGTECWGQKELPISPSPEV
jgi:hypothetical protein